MCSYALLDGSVFRRTLEVAAGGGESYIGGGDKTSKDYSKRQAGRDYADHRG